MTSFSRLRPGEALRFFSEPIYDLQGFYFVEKTSATKRHMKILKVIRDEDRVQFRHEVQGHKAVEERDHTCHEAPLKSFDDALQSLSDAVVNVLELGQGYKKGMKISAVTFSYTKKGTRSAAVTFSKDLDATNGAHRLTTPVFQFDDAAEGEDSGQRRQCTKKHAQLLEVVIEETEKYANGDRQQRLLPLDDADSKAEPQGGDSLPFSTPPDGSDGEGAKPAKKSRKKK